MRFNRALVLSFAISALALSAASGQGSGTSQRENRENDDLLIDKLVATPALGTIYINDGAGDGSVLSDKPLGSVMNILKLGETAVPVLIRHLDDMRLTSAKYKGGAYWNDPIAVPVGYICLDILSQIVRGNGVLFQQGHRDCDFDGVGACIKAPYYFDPSDYTKMAAGTMVPGRHILVVKRNWQAAEKRGLVTYMFPSQLGRLNAYSAIVISDGKSGRFSCTETESRAALDDAVTLRSWDNLYASYERYRQCDDGAISEGYSESIARILVDQWNTLDRFAELGITDVRFRTFVIEHIDSTLNGDDVARIKKNAKSGCEARLRTLCSDLAEQSDSVLNEDK